MEHADGSFAAVLGGSGGGRIFGAVFQVLLNLDWGLDASAAVEYWRVHTQLVPEIVDADLGYPADILAGLLARGHKLAGARTRCFVLKSDRRLHRFSIFFFSDSPSGGCCSTGRATDRRADLWCVWISLIFEFLSPVLIVSAASDSRKNGIAAGF